MKREFRYSEDRDVGELYISPTDLKQFVFCPRVVFFNRVMRLRPIMGAQQEAAQKSHDRLMNLEKRRSTVLLKLDISRPVKKQFEVPLQSESLGVKGRLDMLVVSADGEYIPIEFKEMYSNRGQVRLDHKYQLALLALMVEEKYDVIIRRGVVYYLKDEAHVQLLITESLKKQCKRYLKRIHNMIETEQVPPPRRLCRSERVGCGYADWCRDL